MVSYASSRRLCSAALAATFALATGGCFREARKSSPQVLDVHIEPEESLGVDDILEVRVVGEPEWSGSYRIAADGTIYFPYVGHLPVVGKSSVEVQQMISTKLKPDYLLNPQVTVMVKEWNSRKVQVLGQVQKAGSVAYFPRMTIIDAIAAAGWFTGIAAKNNVTLRREHKGRVETKSYPVADISEGLAGNVYLLPGDVLVVDERMF
jgi:polysaccharide export outer membrane protein